MNKKIVEAFEGVSMPLGCEQKIRAAARKKTGRGGTIFRRLGTAAAAFAAVMVLLFAISPEALAAVEGWVVKYIFPDRGITIYEEKNAQGDTANIMSIDTEQPAFAYVENGRLYFTGNGENIDITDQITEEKPFFYTFVDEEYGLTHFMAVGYHGSIDNFGIYEFLREENEGQLPWEGWAGGTGRNFLNPETETRYPWVDIVWAEWNVPWPKPGE